MKLAYQKGSIAAAAISGLALISPSSRAQDGPGTYARCAACHQANGVGVATVFPPLTIDPRTLASRVDGRRYLVLAVIKGLAGPIVVGGTPYRGVMPAQALDDAAVAAVLNHVCSWGKGSPPKAFSTDEVKAIRAAGTGLTASDVARMQPKG